jgi:hypothetical protein
MSKSKNNYQLLTEKYPNSKKELIYSYLSILSNKLEENCIVCSRSLYQVQPMETEQILDIIPPEAIFDKGINSICCNCGSLLKSLKLALVSSMNRNYLKDIIENAEKNCCRCFKEEKEFKNSTPFLPPKEDSTFYEKLKLLATFFKKNGYVKGCISLCFKCSTEFDEKMTSFKIYELNKISMNLENVITIINSKSLDVDLIRKRMLFCNNCGRKPDCDLDKLLKKGSTNGKICYGPECKGLNEALGSSLYECRGCACISWTYNGQNKYADPTLLPICRHCAHSLNSNSNWKKIDKTLIHKSFTEDVIKAENVGFLPWEVYDFWFDKYSNGEDKLAQKSLFDLFEKKEWIMKELVEWKRVESSEKEALEYHEMFLIKVKDLIHIIPEKKKESPTMVDLTGDTPKRKRN